MSDWGKGAKNNDIGWGQGAVNNDISWGASHKVSWAGDTEIVGTDGNAPVNTIAPVISGTALVGNTLTSTTGTWTSDTGVISYLYQWYRGATLISGATNSTYVLTFADGGFDITCRVAATGTDGTSAYVSSNSILFRSFDFTIKTDNLSTGSSTNTQFKLPLVSSGVINFIVDWGDGTQDTITTFNQAETLHTYSSIGTYNIKIVGTLRGWAFSNSGDRLKMLNISKWSGLTISTDNGFRGCSNMTCSATDTPIITTTDMQSYFRSCTNFNGAIGNWNVSGVSIFANMFLFATNFNQPLNWNMSSATNISAMFSTAPAFNQNIGNWNVSNVANFTGFMLGKTPATFSATNLDAIYSGWSSRPVKPNLSITFGTAKYTASGQAGKDILTGAPNNWTIIDGGI